MIFMNLYFKSLIKYENDYVTKIRKEINSHGKPIYQIHQRLSDMIKNKVINPNTKHNMFKDRLCVTRISNEYDETYRPEGLIFKTDQKPNFCVPFDLMLLTNGKTRTSDDFNSTFINGYELFIFTLYSEMILKYPNPYYAINDLIKIRKKNGIDTTDDVKRYNECCFTTKINIEPVAIIGIDKRLKEYGLPVFKSISDYRKNIIKINFQENI